MNEKEEKKRKRKEGKEEIMTSAFFQESTNGWMLLISNENDRKEISLCQPVMLLNILYEQRKI